MSNMIKDLFNNLVLLEATYNDEIIGMERRLNNMKIKRDELSKQIDFYKKIMDSKPKDSA